MRIALCLIKRLGWWCEDMQSFKNYYLVGTIPLTVGIFKPVDLRNRSRLASPAGLPGILTYPVVLCCVLVCSIPLFVFIIGGALLRSRM